MFNRCGYWAWVVIVVSTIQSVRFIYKIIEDMKNKYNLRVPSNRVAMVSKNVFCGASSPFFIFTLNPDLLVFHRIISNTFLYFTWHRKYIKLRSLASEARSNTWNKICHLFFLPRRSKIINIFTTIEIKFQTKTFPWFSSIEIVIKTHCRYHCCFVQKQITVRATTVLSKDTIS